MLFHMASTALCYTTYANATDGGTAFLLGTIGSGICSAFAVWCLLFAGDGHVSRRTGKDKRTSGMLFRDKKDKAEILKDN